MNYATGTRDTMTLRFVRSGDMRQAGVRAAEMTRIGAKHARHAARLDRRFHELRLKIAATARSDPDGLSLLRVHARLVGTALADIRELGRSLRDYPAVIERPGDETPRACAVARGYLAGAGDKFEQAELQAFLAGYQEVSELNTGELWALKPALEFALLERLAATSPDFWPELLSSLRRLGECSWKDLFESVSIVDRVLERDPAAAYGNMEAESRDAYRNVIADLAEKSGRTEHEIADMAVRLAHRFGASAEPRPAAARRAHVGFYLLDRGLAELRAMAGYRSGIRDRIRGLVLRAPTAFYLGGIEVLTFVAVFMLLSGLGPFPVFAGLILLLLPATQGAVDFMNNLAAFLVPPRVLPKLDFSMGIPEEYATLVAVPSLLLDETRVRELVLDLEIRFLANRDPNLYFALLTDSPDSDRPFDEHDALIGLCRELIEELNRRYGADGRSPFFLLHRHRMFNPSEGRWMGRERKRGKLLDLNRLLRGGLDNFPVKIGDLSVLPRIRFVITLDSDTQLPRDSAARLIGAMAHPLNRAVICPVSRMVIEGYGILQPRIGISIQSASRSRLASLYSGQTGFDIYSRAVSDVYQDLFGEGIFTGKGIYDVDVLRNVLEYRFPDNALLSHDLIEGAYARAGLVSDIELIDDYPSHFSAYSRRKHRWVRGDWQILRWLLSRVPDYHRRMVVNPISVIARWKILDNLRRSLFEPSLLLLLLGGWFFLPGRPLYWTSVALAILFMSPCFNLLFSLPRLRWGRRLFAPWAMDTAEAFAKGILTAALSLVFLLHQGLLSVDAIVRSVLRVFVTRRKLLEWETAAEAETSAGRKATVDFYLEWTPLFSAAIGAALWLMRPEALEIAGPVLFLWFVSRGISAWLNRPPRTSNRGLSLEDTNLLHESAERICRFFRDWSSPETNWLIPDNVRDGGTPALRLSPTNLGMLLNARIAAVHLGVLTLDDFVLETRKTLEQVVALPKYLGHLLNWYDISKLRPVEPYFVSTVDSGNLVAALWTLKQAAVAFAAGDDRLAGELREIAETCETLVGEMDFRFLYQPGKKVLSVGFDISTGRLSESCYDLLASESRIASFVAIAKGDVPQSVWFRLGRAHTLSFGERVLVSWTGTIFEYLMPALWMRHYPATITEQSIRAVVRCQMEYARRKGVPWGISESACTTPSGDEYGYEAFGIPDLGMKTADRESLVISPYSAFLALGADPAAAMNNLHRMEKLGWLGRYGFYEAADFKDGGGEVIRCWMAHHQGMSLLAACNLLFDNVMQRYFHAEPQVLATELLLHERVPSVVVTETAVVAETIAA